MKKGGGRDSGSDEKLALRDSSSKDISAVAAANPAAHNGHDGAAWLASCTVCNPSDPGSRIFMADRIRALEMELADLRAYHHRASDADYQLELREKPPTLSPPYD